MSTMPSFNISRPFPFWAMPEKALLLSTKSVSLLWLRLSVNTTLVPSVLQKLGFLHLICNKRKMISNHKNNSHQFGGTWSFWFAHTPQSKHHNRLHFWRERPHHLQGVHHLCLVPKSHTHMPQLVHTQNSHNQLVRSFYLACLNMEIEAIYDSNEMMNEWMMLLERTEALE